MIESEWRETPLTCPRCGPEFVLYSNGAARPQCVVCFYLATDAEVFGCLIRSSFPVSAAGQRESGPKGDMPENEDVVDMVPCALCNNPESEYCHGCVEFSNFEPVERPSGG